MGQSPTEALSAADRRILLAVLCFCSFAGVVGAQIVGPLLGDLSDTFGVSIPVAGQLVAAYALPAAAFSLVMGPIADRYGRDNVLLVGMVILAVASAVSAFAWNFPLLLLCRAVAGLGAAAVVPTTYGSVGDYFPPEQRGRAIALLVSGNTLAGMVGVPLGALLAQATDWRWTFAATALPVAAAAGLLWWRFPPRKAAGGELAQDYLAGYRAVLRDPGAVPVLVAWGVSSTSWFAWQTYVGPFFQQGWGLSTGALGPIVASMSVGVLIGTNVGGRLGDRYGKPRVAVISLLLVGAFTAALPTLVGPLWVAVLVNFVLCIPNASRFTTIAAIASERAPGGRGTMFAVGVAAGQSAQLLGASLGGLVVDWAHYAGLGLLGGSLSWIAAVILARLPADDSAARPAERPLSRRS